MGCALLSEAPMNQSKTISTRSCSKSFTWNLGLSILDTSVAKSFTSKAPVLLLKVYHLRKQHPSPNCLSSKNNSLPFFFFFQFLLPTQPSALPSKIYPKSVLLSFSYLLPPMQATIIFYQNYYNIFLTSFRLPSFSFSLYNLHLVVKVAF